MWQHLKDNGIDPGEHKLIHAVMGVTDGRACFPVTDKPNEGYGAEADFSGHKSGSEAGNFEQVSCLTLTTLLGKLPPVDLLHCDIQGAEFDVMQAGADAMTRRVRRTVIGTHGREIEANLMDLFGDLGWTLENETACEIQLNTPGRPKLDKDGYQVWSNPAWRP
jgi:FkbM family methyltransferase